MEPTEDGRELPPNNFGLALNDLTGSSDETDAYMSDEARLDDTGASENPEVTAEETAVAQPDA